MANRGRLDNLVKGMIHGTAIPDRNEVAKVNKILAQLGGALAMEGIKLERIAADLDYVGGEIRTAIEELWTKYLATLVTKKRKRD